MQGSNLRFVRKSRDFKARIKEQPMLSDAILVKEHKQDDKGYQETHKEKLRQSEEPVPIISCGRFPANRFSTTGLCLGKLEDLFSFSGHAGLIED